MILKLHLFQDYYFILYYKKLLPFPFERATQLQIWLSSAEGHFANSLCNDIMSCNTTV